MLALKEKVSQLQAENALFKTKIEQEEKRVESCQSQTLLLNTTLEQLKVAYFFIFYFIFIVIHF